MKVKITLISLFLFGLMVFSQSCKKTTEELIDNITPTFSAEVDGVVWKTNSVIALKTDTAFVTTATEDSTLFILSVKAFKNGKFTIDGTNAIATYSNDNSANLYIATRGEIEVLEAEDHGGNFNMKFHFTAFNLNGDSVVVTNGDSKNIVNPL